MIKGRKSADYYHAELIRTQHQIFNELGIPVDYGKRYCNPLRSDNEPGCTFKQASNGIIYFNDWAQPQYSGNAFKLYKLKHSKNPDTQQYGPPIRTPMPQKKSKLKRATYLAKMTQQMIEYFARVDVDITSVRGRYKVLEVSRLFIGDDVVRPNGLCMSYLYPSGNQKIYRPFADKKKKFLSTTNKYDIWGWDPLAEKMAITSSMKDAITLGGEDTGRTFLAPQSEQHKFPYEMLDMIRDRDGYVIYDNDKAGIESALKIKEFGIPAFVVPEHKDPYGFKSQSRELIIPNLIRI